MAYENGNLTLDHVLLKRSSGSTGDSPTLPTAANLESGEIAINFLAGKETIAVKNSSGEVASFSSDQVFIKNKIGDRFADGGDYSGKTVQTAIIENEQTFAAALNVLSGAIESISAMVETIALDVEGLKNGQ